MDVSVAIRDETLYAVQIPATVSLVVRSFQHNGLKVGTCVRLRQVHRHGLSVANTRDVTLALILVAELV